MSALIQWTIHQIGPLGGPQSPILTLLGQHLLMPGMATNTPWFPVMEPSMSGETIQIQIPQPGGGGGGQNLLPLLTSGIARDGKARNGKAGIGTHASNGTSNARNGKTGAQWSAPAPPNPDRLLYRGVGADKEKETGERNPCTPQAHENQPEQGSERQMHELHTKAREIAKETDPEKLKKWEEEQSIWLDMVAREEAEKRASASSQPDDGSTEAQPEEGSQNMPDDGTAAGDKAPADVVICNTPRSRSQSAESRGMRRFYSGRSNPSTGCQGPHNP